MNLRSVVKFFAVMTLSMSSLSMAAVRQVTFTLGISEGDRTKTVSGYGSFTYDDNGLADDYFLKVNDIVSLSFTASGSEVIGKSSSFSLSDCTRADIGPIRDLAPGPGFGRGIMSLDCDNGVNTIVSLGNSFVLNPPPGEIEIAYFVFAPLKTGKPDTDNGLTDTIKMSLQEPQNGSVYSGVGNLRGWAITFDKSETELAIERVELFIDGQFSGLIPYGGPRNDVGSKYAKIPGAFDSGFSMALGYNGLGAGKHTITVRAFTNTGVFKEHTAVFNVVAFHKPFFPNPDSIKLSNSELVKDGSDMVIRNLSVDGKSYDVRLRWNNRTQGFELIKIQ